MLLVHEHRRGFYAIAGERRRGAGWRVRHNQCKVRASAGLQARFGSSETEALRYQNFRNLAHAFRESGRLFPAGFDWIQTFNLTGGGSMTETGASAPEIDEHQFLELEHVNVARGERIVLHDLNLGIRAGEHVA